MKYKYIIVIWLVVALGSLGACSSSAVITPTDTPYLSSTEAIAIARQHSLSSDVSPTEYQAGTYTRGSQVGNFKNLQWQADYFGKGRWLVVLKVPLQDSSMGSMSNGGVYSWTVYDDTRSALYIGSKAIQ